jgi:hypothetical protein
MATLRLVNVKQRRPRKTAREKGVKEMMEMLKRLGKRSRPHPGEDREQSKPAKRLRWYHKVFVVPALALAIFGAVSVAAPNEAQAHDWYAYSPADPAYYQADLTCWDRHYHFDIYGGTNFRVPYGCRWWDTENYVWAFQYMDLYGYLDGPVYYWDGYNWIYWY